MLKSTLVELSERMPGSHEMLSSVGLAQSMASSNVIEHAHERGLRHLVQKDGLAYDQELAASKIMIESPNLFFKDPLSVIFGKSEKKDPQTTAFFNKRYDVTEKKSAVLEEFSRYLSGLAKVARIWDQALLVADELYTNGIKNAWAPRKVGEKLFEGRPELNGHVDFFAHSENGRLAIGCQDSFGRLEMSTVLSRIMLCYKNGVANSIRRGNGGAGIGSYMVFESCVSYYVAVEPGVSSVVCVVLPIGISLSQAADLPKNIHLLSHASKGGSL
jgi:hypothetical protein